MGFDGKKNFFNGNKANNYQQYNKGETFFLSLHCLYNFLFTHQSESRLYIYIYIYIYKIYLVFFLHFDLLLYYLDSTFSEMSSLKNDVIYIAFIINWMWQPCIEQICWHHFSNNICSFHVFVSHFGNSWTVSSFFIIIIFVMVTRDPLITSLMLLFQKDY